MRSARGPLLVLSLAAFATACSGTIDPTGVYETSARSHAAEVTKNAGDASSDDTFAKARLADLPKAAVDWQMTLQLDEDHKFALTTSKPVASRREGTWRWDGDRLELTTRTDGGRALQEPRVQHAQVDGEKLRFSPDLVLHKVEPAR